jgi:hypothetical protein
MPLWSHSHPQLGCPPARFVDARFVLDDVLRVAQHAMECVEISTGLVGGAGLNEDVAECGGFDRSGPHGQAAGVGGELAEQFVASAAADDVDDVDVPAGEPGRGNRGGFLSDLVRDQVADACAAGRRCGCRRTRRWFVVLKPGSAPEGAALAAPSCQPAPSAASPVPATPYDKAGQGAADQGRRHSGRDQG